MIRPTKISEIKRKWYLFDAKDQILGRLATKIVPLLIGKDKPYFVQYLDCSDHVVVINASEIKVTGRKEKQKKYYHYSGYPGGLREQKYLDLKEKHPEKILINSLERMLPKNKLRQKRLNNLHVFAGSTHPFAEKFGPVGKKEKVRKMETKKIK